MDQKEVAPKKIFVLACDKSGTVWLADTISKLCGDAVRVRHELRPADDWGMASALWHGAVSEDCVVTWLRASRSMELYHAKTLPQYAYIEVNSGLFSLSSALRKAFPGCLIVGLLRDGRDVVRSGLNKGWYDESFDPYWEPLRLRPHCDFGPTTAWEKWENMSRVERCTWYWAEMVSAFLAHIQPFYFTVKLEDLVGEHGYETWQRFTEKCGLKSYATEASYRSLAARPKNVTEKKPWPKFAEWSPAEQSDFWKWGGSLMSALGYLLAFGNEA